jgi:hypothetical protein
MTGLLRPLRLLRCFVSPLLPQFLRRHRRGAGRRGERSNQQNELVPPTGLPTGASPSVDAELDRFVARLRQRLVVGAQTYGDESFRRPAAELVDEVMEELEDVAGWSLLLWIRLERLRDRVIAVVEGGPDGAT